ncbi:WecB/TagA/CpsF family glycosyltransferase [Gordonia sp. NPDC057258]|uniref:WecB/TagA/CpsF family glycosyltransferase n=1 Tax=unclassified Gordonia (in: high G+C Gram-positive bacteria) TaxID=2657482 RepID=UPI003628BC69
MSIKAAEKVPFIDIPVTAMTADEVVDVIVSAVDSGSGSWVGNFNLHAVYEWHTNPLFRDNCARANYWIIDGFPVLAAWSLKRRTIPRSRFRVGSTDWLNRLLEREIPLTIIGIGADPESSRRAAEYFNHNHASITWYAYDGFSFERQDNLPGESDLELHIESADLILVGLGMPRQEEWIADRLDGVLMNKVVANVGGCIDYYSGRQKLAPRWMGGTGLEWAYRLARSPRRLAYRYLVEPIMLLGVLVRRACTRTDTQVTTIKADSVVCRSVDAQRDELRESEAKSFPANGGMREYITKNDGRDIQ